VKLAGAETEAAGIKAWRHASLLITVNCVLRYWNR